MDHRQVLSATLLLWFSGSVFNTSIFKAAQYMIVKGPAQAVVSHDERKDPDRHVIVFVVVSLAKLRHKKLPVWIVSDTAKHARFNPMKSHSLLLLRV